MSDRPAFAVTVVGLGEDGWSGLGETARAALTEADVVIGSPRQVELVRSHVARLETWPSGDLVTAAHALPDTHRGQRVVVLGSGDPSYFGIATTLVEALGPDAVAVVPQPSSVSLACARLGWPVESCAVLSAVARPVAALTALLHPGARVLVLTSENDGSAQVAEVVRWSGLAARLTVLERLGGSHERVTTHPLDATVEHDRLSIVAVECDRTSASRMLSRAPGLPDDAFLGDGVITKREVRAVTLAALVPVPGQLLWDVGAGSGTVAVEWMRTDARCRAIAIEPRTDRCSYIRANADGLGVPALQVVEGEAPGALADLPMPDAVFVGGGAGDPDVIETCLDALGAGGRLVVNAVTTETESALVGWQARVGGLLRRIQIAHAEPVGAHHAFRPALPITQWVHTVGGTG